MSKFEKNTIHKPNCKGIVLLNELCGWSLFPLLASCFKLSPVAIYYCRASKVGLMLVAILKFFRLVSGIPKEVKENDLCFAGTKNSGFFSIKLISLKFCLQNRDKLNTLIAKLLPKFDPYFRQVCSAGVIKQWADWLEPLVQQQSLAKKLAIESEIPTRNVVVISHMTFLLDLLEVDSEYLNEVKILKQSIQNKTHLYLWAPIIYILGQILKASIKPRTTFKTEKLTSQKGKGDIGVAAAWGFEGIGKKTLDDFFWWRHSTIIPERLLYMFERPDYQPTQERLDSLEKLGINSIALNQTYSGDAPESMIRQNTLSLKEGLKRFYSYSKVISRGGLKDSFSRSVCSWVIWQLYCSDELAKIYGETNLKVLFHHQETGHESVTLATLRTNTLRIGTHWSCLNAPYVSSFRCHEVYFAWGAHDLKIILDSESPSKNLLISGCFLSEYSNEEEVQKGTEAVQLMKNRGARYTVALFDSSVIEPNFYRFFLDWLINDPALGIIIKSKGGTSWDKFKEGSSGRLAQQAINTGRFHVMSANASPADAGLLSDFSVGTTGISAIVVAALKGAKVLFLDYEKIGQGLVKPYGIFHSLGPKRCAFYEPEILKEAILEYINNPESNPYLGDASPILDKIDPFRDGKTSQRIGEYVSWYLEGIDQNLSKDDAIRKAIDKYAEKWGADKVIRRS